MRTAVQIVQKMEALYLELDGAKMINANVARIATHFMTNNLN